MSARSRLALWLLIGGIAAAPFGAWAAKHIPAKSMLIMVFKEPYHFLTVFPVSLQVQIYYHRIFVG